MKPLPDLARDGILTKAFWSQVKNTINANFREVMLQPGVGYTVTNSPGGQTLFIKSSGISGNTVTNVPFDIFTTTGVDNLPAITFWPGLVNGILAENMLDTFAVDDSSLWYLKAVCTSSGTQITGVSMVVDTTPADIQTPAENAMPGSVDVLVGLYKAGLKYNLAAGNVTLTPTQVSNADGNYSGSWV